MKVVLRHIGKNAWSGIVKYKNCADYLGTYLTRTGRVYTGLSKEDEKRLGEELKLDLSPSSDFWKTFFIRIGIEDVILDTTDPMNELQYLFLKEHKRVKTSVLENKATADYVMINLDEEAKVLNKAHQTKRKAFREFDRMTQDEMRKCLRVFGYNSDHSTGEVLEQRMVEIVEDDPQKFLDNWVNNPIRETEFLIKQAVSKNVIRKNKSTYRYGTDIIGNTLEDAASFLDNKNNQELKITITREVENK